MEGGGKRVHSPPPGRTLSSEGAWKLNIVPFTLFYTNITILLVQRKENFICLLVFYISIREFTLAEIEHFVDPSDKSHPKFPNVSDLKVTLYPAKHQMDGEPAFEITLGDAINRVIIAYP